MNQKIYLGILVALLCTSHSSYSTEETIRELLRLPLEELMQVNIVVGTRSKGRSLAKSPVPIDIITAEDIAVTGYGELGKVLQRLLPSFNFPHTFLADGTDHTRPFTLRGMGADQVLVLINGKRRHSGALLHVNATIGRGSNGVDINMIPIQAIERIEVLRDGASAQYGSDAIAGIINIILKQDTRETLNLNIGQTKEHDGQLTQLAFTTGKSLENNGFINVSGEIRHRGATNRSGLDTRQQYFTGDLRNDAPATVTHQVGDAELDDFLLMTNAELPADDDLSYYTNASLGYRQGNTTGFFRRPLDNRNVRTIYPDGFLPQIAPDIADIGITVGAKSDKENDWQWDASYTFGHSDFNFLIENSLNASLGTNSQTKFDSGSLKASQHIIGLDLFKAMDVGWKNPLSTGLGIEGRREIFKIKAGEPNSYLYGGIPVLDGPNAGDKTSAGAQVFPGFKPANATNVSRHNISMYLDLEYPFTEQLLTQAALRYEHYSDFGSTLNGKLATAYTASDSWAIRASASTGFRAPSLAQSHFTSTATAFIGNEPLEIGTFNVSHPLAQALGATELKPEKSLHLSTGFNYKADEQLLFSADYFFTRINDRIVLSGDIEQNVDVYGQAVADVLQQFNTLGARFFTNAIDTETQGIDISAKYDLDLSKGQHLNLTAQYHINDTKIIGEVRAPAILGANGADIILDRFERVQHVESGQPNSTVILSALYQYHNWGINLRLQRFGSYQLVNYLNAPEYDQTISAKWITDLDLSYQFSKQLEFAVGAHNLFDLYPDANLSKENDSFSGEGKIIPYSTNSPFGYNGAFYYLRLKYNF